MRKIIHTGILIALLLASSALSAGTPTLFVNSVGDGARSGSAPAGVCTTGATVPGPDDNPVAECTLRAAIQTANANGGATKIHFADYIPQNSSNPPASMFSPTTALPTLTVPIELNGFTHPAWDSVANRPAVIIRGNSMTTSNPGLVILGNSSSGSMILGVAVYNFSSTGIVITGSNNNRISGSHIGINASGASAMPNSGGILVNGNDNIIGNPPALAFPPPKPNLISGNSGYGILVNGGSGNLIANNLIGLNLSGNNVVANSGSGIQITGNAQNTRIGGHVTAVNLTYKRFNFIAGNLGGQILLESSQPTRVECNIIGARPDLSASLPAPLFGVRILSDDNIIGSEICENVIAAAPTAIEVGIMTPQLEIKSSYNLLENNYIGMSPAGTALGGGEFGIRVAYGDGNTVWKNIVGNVFVGVQFGFTHFNTAFGNFVGVDQQLNAHPVNTGFLSEGQELTFIGGPFDDGKNIIGNFETAIHLVFAEDSYVINNWVGIAPDGTDIAGANALFGIRVSGNDNLIGYSINDYGNFVGAVPTGIRIANPSSTGNMILGNAIGVSRDGFIAPGNGSGIGIDVRAPDNLIEANRVGLYSEGIFLDFDADNTVVYGNEIGAGFDGVTFGNSNVGLIALSDFNTIGGGPMEQRNLVGDNLDGIVVAGQGNQIRGAYVGVMPNGDAVGNARHGIRLLPTAINSYIGHQSFSGVSYIAANGQHGIYSQAIGTVLDLVYIGITPNDGSPAGNGGDGLHLATVEQDLGLHTFIYRSQIHNNLGFGANLSNSTRGGHFFSEISMTNNQSGGIHLGPGGRDQDPSDADTGPNNLQNFPEFDPIASGANYLNNQLQVRFRVDSSPANSNYPLHLEFYIASAEASPQAFMPVGTLSYVETDAGQWVTTTVDLYPGIVLSPGGQLFVATATAMGDQSFATSEFSEIFGADFDMDRIFHNRFESAAINFSTHLAPSFRHPRCTTCHAVAATNFANVNDDPPGVLPASHPEVSAATDCTSCHSSSLLPPTGSIDPGWQSAPPQFDFRDKSDSQLCNMASQPVSGHSPLEHMTEDRLVLWAVGDGRVPFGGTLSTAPPNDIEQWRALIQQWVAAGMPCD